nr:protein argonaute 4A-like [Ipomoea batatas]
MRESKSEPSFPAAFLLSQPALNRLDFTDALSTLLLIPFLLRFKIADRRSHPSPPFAFFSLRSPQGLQSPFAQAARPPFAVVSSVALAHRLAGRRSRRPPALCRCVFGRLRTPPSPFAVRTGTSETQVFDEQSPSGKDYLAEFHSSELFVFKRSPAVGVDAICSEFKKLIIVYLLLEVLVVVRAVNVRTQSAKLDFLHKKVLDTKDDGIFSSGERKPDQIIIFR